MNWPTHVTHNGVLKRITGWCVKGGFNPMTGEPMYLSASTPDYLVLGRQPSYLNREDAEAAADQSPWSEYLFIVPSVRQ